MKDELIVQVEKDYCFLCEKEGYINHWDLVKPVIIEWSDSVLIAHAKQYTRRVSIYDR